LIYINRGAKFYHAARVGACILKTQQNSKGARRERPNWGLAQLMRPAKAAPAVPFAICRYANTRTFASAIVAAFWPGGTIQILRA